MRRGRTFCAGIVATVLALGGGLVGQPAASLVEVGRDYCYPDLIVVGQAVSCHRLEAGGCDRSDLNVPEEVCEFRVDRVIVGPPLRSLELLATAKIASGDPFLLFLRDMGPHGDLPAWAFPHYFEDFELDLGAPVPDELLLRARWKALCDAYPDGLQSERFGGDRAGEVMVIRLIHNTLLGKPLQARGAIGSKGS